MCFVLASFFTSFFFSFFVASWASLENSEASASSFLNCSYYPHKLLLFFGNSRHLILIISFTISKLSQWTMLLTHLQSHKAPCVDGFDTKSNAIQQIMLLTSTVPSSPSARLPVPQNLNLEKYRVWIWFKQFFENITSWLLNTSTVPSNHHYPKYLQYIMWSIV